MLPLALILYTQMLTIVAIYFRATIEDLVLLGADSRNMIFGAVRYDYDDNYLPLYQLLTSKIFLFQSHYITQNLDADNAKWLIAKVIRHPELHPTFLPMDWLVRQRVLAKEIKPYLNLYQPGTIYLDNEENLKEWTSEEIIFFSKRLLTSPKLLGSLETADLVYKHIGPPAWELINSHDMHMESKGVDTRLKLISALVVACCSKGSIREEVVEFIESYLKPKGKKLTKFEKSIESYLAEKDISSNYDIILQTIKELTRTKRNTKATRNAKTTRSRERFALWHAKLLYSVFCITNRTVYGIQRLQYHFILQDLLEEFLAAHSLTNIPHVYLRQILIIASKTDIELRVYPKSLYQTLQQIDLLFGDIPFNWGGLKNHVDRWRRFISKISNYLEWPRTISNAQELMEFIGPHQVLCSILPVSSKLPHAITFHGSDVCHDTICFLKRATDIFLQTNPYFLVPVTRMYRIGNIPTEDFMSKTFTWLLATNLLHRYEFGIPLTSDSIGSLCRLPIDVDITVVVSSLLPSRMCQFIPSDFFSRPSIYGVVKAIGIGLLVLYLLILWTTYPINSFITIIPDDNGYWY